VDTNESCCWGILGAADIVRKNWQAIHRSGNGHLKAIASRSGDRAATLIKNCQQCVPVEHPVSSVEGYDKLLADPEIDAVYIPLPTRIRDRWAKAAIAAGKHLLLEKPCATSASNLADVIADARARNLQFMDGVMFTHSKRFRGLMDAIHRQRVIGDVRRITSQFSFFANQDWAQSNIRGNSNLEPFGALGDLGWYSIRIILAANGERLPNRVSGRVLQSFRHEQADDPVPLEFEGSLLFDNQVSASLYCSFVTQNQQWTHLSGTEGFISLDDFTLPYCGRKPRFEVVKSQFVKESCDFNMHRNEQVVEFDESANSGFDSQEANLFREFNSCVLSGNIDSVWPTASLNTQMVMDALMTSAGQDRPIALDPAISVECQNRFIC